jgi:hypothetical protein
MAELTLPLIEDLKASNKDNRERLQKSMRAGLLNVVKSVDRLHSSFTQLANAQIRGMRQQMEADSDQHADTLAASKDDKHGLLDYVQSFLQFQMTRNTDELEGKTDQLRDAERENNALVKDFIGVQKVFVQAQAAQSGMFRTMGETFLSMSRKLSDIRAAVTNQVEFFVNGEEGRLRKQAEDLVRAIQAGEGSTSGNINALREIEERLQSFDRYAESIAETHRKYAEGDYAGDDPRYMDLQSSYGDVVSSLAGLQNSVDTNTAAVEDNSNVESRNTRATQENTNTEKKTTKDFVKAWTSKDGPLTKMNESLKGIGRYFKEKREQFDSGKGVGGGLLEMLGVNTGGRGLASMAATGGVKLTAKLLLWAAGFMAANPPVAAALVALAGVYALNEYMEGKSQEDISKTAADPGARAGQIAQDEYSNPFYSETLGKSNMKQELLAAELQKANSELGAKDALMQAREMMQGYEPGTISYDEFGDSMAQAISGKSKEMVDRIDKQVELAYAQAQLKALEAKLNKDGQLTGEDAGKMEQLDTLIQRLSAPKPAPDVTPIKRGDGANLNSKSAELGSKPTVVPVPVPAAGGGGNTTVQNNSQTNITQTPVDVNFRRHVDPDPFTTNKWSTAF